jgi:hypothetical protein
LVSLPTTHTPKSPFPNPQSPIPNPQNINLIEILNNYFNS